MNNRATFRTVGKFADLTADLIHGVTGKKCKQALRKITCIMKAYQMRPRNTYTFLESWESLLVLKLQKLPVFSTLPSPWNLQVDDLIVLLSLPECHDLC